jgi:hypothetical protein
LVVGASSLDSVTAEGKGAHGSTKVKRESLVNLEYKVKEGRKRGHERELS